MTLTFDEAVATLAELKRFATGWGATGAEGGAVRVLMGLDHDHVERVRAAFKDKPARCTPEGLLDAIEDTAPSTEQQIVDQVVGGVPYELLLDRMGECPITGQGFDPLFPRWRLPDGESCTYNDPEALDCACRRCQYRNALGSPGAWRAAFLWAQHHDKNGKRRT